MTVHEAAAGGLDVGLLKKISLLIFFGIFLVVALRLLLTRKDHYAEASRIPLEDDRVVTPRRGGAPLVDKEAKHG